MAAVGNGTTIGLYGDNGPMDSSLMSTFGWVTFSVSPTPPPVVDFIGIPRTGSSPLVVDFTATVQNKTIIVKEYRWYFDYENHPDSYIASSIPTITHVYYGYYGQTYTVKLTVIFM